MKHIPDTDLALYAGRELGFWRRILAARHLTNCTRCSQELELFQEMRSELAAHQPDLEGINWTSLSQEMTANIHLGLEAGECIRMTVPQRRTNQRLVIAFASLCVLAGAGVLMKYERGLPIRSNTTPMLASTAPGLELRAGQNSMVLLQRGGKISNQTVGAQGELQARYVDSDTGSVTINNVYLEQ